LIKEKIKKIKEKRIKKRKEHEKGRTYRKVK
jgi:hypothetical protein